MHYGMYAFGLIMNESCANVTVLLRHGPCPSEEILDIIVPHLNNNISELKRQDTLKEKQGDVKETNEIPCSEGGADKM